MNTNMNSRLVGLPAIPPLCGGERDYSNITPTHTSRRRITTPHRKQHVTAGLLA